MVHNLTSEVVRVRLAPDFVLTAEPCGLVAVVDYAEGELDIRGERVLERLETLAALEAAHDVVVTPEVGAFLRHQWQHERRRVFAGAVVSARQGGFDVWLPAAT